MKPRDPRTHLPTRKSPAPPSPQEKQFRTANAAQKLQAIKRQQSAISQRRQK